MEAYAVQTGIEDVGTVHADYYDAYLRHIKANLRFFSLSAKIIIFVCYVQA
jgi:hypothetical protein